MGYLNCRISELRYKDVINVCDGTRLGCVCDVEVDTVTAKVCAIVIYGRWKCFGLFGREDDIVICWNDIKVIGYDSILVNFQCPVRSKKFGGFFDKFFK